MRDDFTLETKIQLAKRVGFHCSFPGCGSLTIGPSRESEKSTSSVSQYHTNYFRIIIYTNCILKSK